MFDSQTLEYDIRFLIFILTDLEIIDFDPLKAEKISDGDTKHTIGGLIKIIRDKTSTKEDQDEIINLGIDARNILIHHFMMDNIERIVSTAEREKMVLEIRELRKNIQKADRVIKNVIEMLVPKYGLSVEKYIEMVKQEFQYTHSEGFQ